MYARVLLVKSGDKASASGLPLLSLYTAPRAASWEWDVGAAKKRASV